MLRESFTSPHYTLYHYICPLIHTSQGRSKGVFIVLSDGEGRLWRLETPGGSGWSRATWSQAGGWAIPWIHRLTSSHGPYCSSKAVIGRLAVEDDGIWRVSQAGQLGGKPGGLGLSRAAWVLSPYPALLPASHIFSMFSMFLHRDMCSYKTFVHNSWNRVDVKMHQLSPRLSRAAWWQAGRLAQEPVA
ncbi:hypothetical protein U9M48_031547 [Paspalum notatum var. saurae]|uniref:Uncharacterized protein n=1 Tax=Paspalum notatum var. saurae TaxID=547442 RepID=A0AAQ3X4U3_PASNO